MTANTNTNTVTTKEKLNTYIRGVKAEVKKVIWPSKKDLINYTGVVILLSTIVALIVYVIDLGINQILSLIIQ